MSEDLRSSGDDVGGVDGPTLWPESEKQQDTPHSGEVSPEALAKPSTPALPHGNSTQPTGAITSASQTQQKIVRATCKIQLCGVKAFLPQLWDAQKDAAKIRNAITMELWKLDAEAVQNGVPKPWKMPNPVNHSNWYQFALEQAPELSTGIVAAAVKAASDKWRDTRFDVLVRMVCSPPFYRRNGSFPVRAQELKILHVNGEFFASIPLKAGRGMRVEIPLYIKHKDSHLQQMMLALVNGTARIERRDAKIEFNERTKKWFVRFSYKRLVDQEVRTKTAAINRGMRCFLMGVTESDEKWDYSGKDIEAHLKQIQRRRRAYQNAWPASNRHGRGRNNALAPTQVLQGRARNWRATKLQTIAKRFTKWLVARDVKRLYVEDFEGIRHGPEDALEGGKFVWDRVQEWACYELLQRLVSCCEAVSIEVWKVPATKISTTCPRCGKDGEKDLRYWMLRCSACKYRRDLDYAAAQNVLARGVASLQSGTEIEPLDLWAKAYAAAHKIGKSSKSKTKKKSKPKT